MLLRSWIAGALVLTSSSVWADEMAFPMLIETPRGTIEVVLASADMGLLPVGDCLPSCVQPATIGAVVTVAEPEVLAFLTGDLASGGGLVIDPRLPEVHALGALPGAVNLPLPTLGHDNPYLGDVLHALGASGGEAGGYDFSQAKTILIHGNGPWEDEAAMAVRALVELGYPADKLRYYRGGIRDWMLTGLALAKPAVQG